MIKRISVDDLRPGMRVAELDKGLWLAHPLLYAVAGVIKDWDAVREIRQAGFGYAFVEVGSDVPLTIRGQVELTDEVTRARSVYAEATGVAHHVFVRAAAGKPLDVEPPLQAVESISDSVCRNPEAMHCLARLTPLEGHLATHSVNVAILCVAFGTYLGLDRDSVMELGLAGMLHDIGKAKVPKQVLEKPGKLTPQEYKAMKAHSMHGLSLMHGRKGASKRLKQAVVEHHERHDGAGYPLGLSGQAITPFARYIGLADTFDAMTSRRTYKKGMLPSRALALIYQQRGSQFAPDDVDLFVKCLGVYPTGSVVRLSDGRTGVVYETNPELPLSPIVSIVMDPENHPVTPQVVNLAAETGPNGRVEVVSALCPSDTCLDLSILMNA